jgi:hypothetical protein
MKTIRQTVVFRTASAEVFELLMDSRKPATGVPDDQIEPIKAGWKEHYGEKMKIELARSK